MRQQRFHLAAEVIIPGTRLSHEFASAAFFHLQGSVKDLFDLSPALLRSIGFLSAQFAQQPGLG